MGAGLGFAALHCDPDREFNNSRSRRMDARAMELIDFPDEVDGETVSVNPALVTHVIEVGRGGDKYTEIFVVGVRRSRFMRRLMM